MWLIFIVTLVSALIFVVFKAFLKKKIKAEWIKTTIETLFVFLFIPLCFHFITSYVQDKKNEIFQKTLLNAVYANSVNTEQLDELIKLKHKEIFQSSTKDAKIFANKLLADLDNKKKELVGLSNNSSELIKKLHLKWKPFYDFVLSSFDDLINILINNDDRIKYSKNGHNPIIFDADLKKYPSTSLRGFEVEGKTLFRIIYDSGKVREGLCIAPLVMKIYEREYNAFNFIFWEDRISLDPSYKKYKMLYTSTKMNDPLEDVELRKKTIEAINLLISSSYIR